MSDTAAHLVDRLLPPLPYRQWVMTFPFKHRHRMAKDPQLLSHLLALFLRAVFAWQRRKARALGLPKPLTAAVTFVQRFGGALNSNPHFHSLLPDGVFTLREEQGLTFHPLPAPTDADVERLTLTIARKVERSLAGDVDDVAVPEAEAMDTALDVSRTVTRQTALWNPPPEPPKTPRCAHLAGYSLHANTAIAEHDRQGLERLCRYGLRAPFAMHRFSKLHDGNIQYRLKRPWPDGTRALTLSPLELLARLAALIPPPYSNMVRYHGLFSPNANGRSELQALMPTAADLGDKESSTPSAEEEEPLGPRKRYLPWAALLRRIFLIELLCPACKTPMKLIAQITEPETIAAILKHLGLPTTAPVPEPARLEPAEEQQEIFEEEVMWPDEQITDAVPRGPPNSRLAR